jgi:hypothetical protein
MQPALLRHPTLLDSCPKLYHECPESGLGEGAGVAGIKNSPSIEPRDEAFSNAFLL